MILPGEGEDVYGFQVGDAGSLLFEPGFLGGPDLEQAVQILTAVGFFFLRTQVAADLKIQRPDPLNVDADGSFTKGAGDHSVTMGYAYKKVAAG